MCVFVAFGWWALRKFPFEQFSTVLLFRWTTWKTADVLPLRFTSTYTYARCSCHIFFLLFVAQFTSSLCCIVPAQHIYILQQFLSFVRWLLFLLIRLTVILDGFLFIWAPYECIMIAIMNVCSCCWIMVWEWWNQLLCKCFDIKVDKLVKSLANEDV